MDMESAKYNNTADQKPTETAFEYQQYKSLSEAENATQGQINGLQSNRENSDAKMQESAVYREYQKNIKLSGQLRTEITKGVKQGEDIASLFLKAVKVISLMTSNDMYYNQIRDEITAIYGAGLLETKPLEMELHEVQNRIQKLTEASQRSTETDDNRRKILQAIQAHEEKAKQLESLMAKP